MPRWRRPSDRQRLRRYQIYNEWIAEDIAAMLAERVPVTSEVGRELLRIMQERVRDAMDAQPTLSREEIVDQVTTDTINDVESGLIDEETEWALYYLVSP